MSRLSGARGAVLADVGRLPATALRFAAEAVRWMIVAPVVNERIRLERRSAGVRALTMVSVAFGAVLVVLVIGATRIRSASDLAVNVSAGSTLSFPRGVIWVFVLSLCLFIALLQAAAMHSTLWFRGATLFVVSLMLVFVGSIDSTGGMSTGVWVALAAVAALVVLEAVTWRRDPVWWEPLVVLAIVVAVFAVVYSRSGDVAQSFGIDRVPLLTDSVIRQFRVLAVPLAIFAGVAVAKVALSGMTLVSDFSSKRFSPVTFTVIAVVVVAWRVVSLALAWIDDIRADGSGALRDVGGVAVTLATVVGLWWLAHRLLDLADARAGRVDDDDAPVVRSATTVEGIIERLDDVAIPTSIVLAILTVPTFVATTGGQVSFVVFGADVWLTDWLSRVVEWVTADEAVRWARMSGAVGVIGFGLWLGHLGRRGVAELTTAIGGVVLMRYLTDSQGVFRGWGFAPEVVDRVGVLAAAVAMVVWAMRRTLTTDRTSVLLLLVLIASLMGERDFVSSPLTALIGTSGIALVLFGFVWNFLAEAGKTAEGTRGFPRDSRLLLFLSQTLFGLTVLAWVALSRDPSSGLDLSAASDLGDAFLGVALLLVVYLTVFTGALRSAELVDGSVLAESFELPFEEVVEVADEFADAVDGRDEEASGSGA